MARQPLALAFAFLLLAGVVCGSSTATPPETNPNTTTTITTSPTTPKTTTTTPTTTTTTHTTTTTTPTTTTTATTTTTTHTTTHITNTTTEEHNTTTASSTTVETTTTTTPVPEGYYYVTDNSTKNKTYCIIFVGSFNYSITYKANSTKGKTSNVTVSLTSPKHPQAGAKVTGSCGKTQFLSFNWASGKRNITMDFSKSKDGKTWSLGFVTANILMDPKTFPDAVDINKTLTIVAYFDLNPSDIPVNSSYSCISSVQNYNVTGSINRNTSYDLEISATLNQDFQMEAYNLKQQGNFTTAIDCTKRTPTIVPIIVGCVLAGMVLVVLIIYLVGRRRRGSSYDSI
ncbi:macrosialin-like [Macrobrachium rosenbergii]|uniref:macrosialin-like n=1 Tax=Macrobrachium rosenbergii TaxID=79674 RepID=UPI0034D77249